MLTLGQPTPRLLGSGICQRRGHMCTRVWEGNQGHNNPNPRVWPQTPWLQGISWFHLISNLCPHFCPWNQQTGIKLFMARFYHVWVHISSMAVPSSWNTSLYPVSPLSFNSIFLLPTTPDLFLFYPQTHGWTQTQSTFFLPTTSEPEGFYAIIWSNPCILKLE